MSVSDMRRWLILMLVALGLSITSLASFSAEEAAAEERASAENTTAENTAEDKTAEDNPAEDTTVAAEDTASQAGAEEQQPAPNPEFLRTRKLSEAFEQFVPSESISADNAVPFPVDI